MDVITTHLNADFDALASAVAAKKYYPDAVIVFPGSQEKTVRDFLSVSHSDLNIVKLKDLDMERITRLILVDTKNPERIGKFAGLPGRKDLVIHIYDHHPLMENDIKGQKEIIENVGATTTIFADMLHRDRVPISPVEATILMLGIYEETGSLLFSSTTERDISAAAYLLKRGANLNIVSSFITREPGPEEIRLLNDLLQSSREYIIHDARIRIAKASREMYIGDIAALAHKMHDMEDTDALFLIVMMEDRVQVIGRSNTPEVDTAEVLREMGGGGHPQASSAVIRDMSLEETENRLIAVLKEKIRPTKTAQDIMTRPVKCIMWKSTVKSAEKTMTKYEVNVLPVLRDNRFYGIISREVVEKALFHGFGKNRVSEFCTTDVPSVAPGASLNDIEVMMIEQNQRFMPVVENRLIVGAITRTDLLRSLYESILRKNRIREGETVSTKPSMGKNILSVLKGKFPSEIFSLLQLSGEVARDLGFSAYLVGGSVRDLIRGESNLDIDIVIEGDGIAFARELGGKLHVKVKTRNRFGTAVVITDFLKFDVATARTEYYESPAALPRVETSSIKKDLYRRDFTINTLAVKLNPGGFGQLIDYFGGQKDIKEKTIRILHNLSFIEDPTRAFRAIRFSERFGFKISKHTVNLIKTAVRINLFNKLSGTRMYDEMNLLFLETEPIRALKRLAQFDLLKFIHPHLSFTKPLQELLESLQETFAWFKLTFIQEEINKSHLFLMALIDMLEEQERYGALERLAVPKRVRDELIAGITQADQALDGLKSASPDRIYYSLQPLDIQTILFAMAKAKDDRQKKEISLYLTSLRHISPEMNGNDLQAMGLKPGPLFKKIFKEILERKLNGEIKTRADEEQYVKKHFPAS